MINRQRICDEFSKQAAIDSPSFAEAEIAAYLEQRLTALGAEIEYDEAGAVIGSTASNLIARIPGSKSGEPLILSGHMDTVTPADNVQPVLKDGIFTSAGDTILGSDDKAGLTEIIEAIEVLREQNIPHVPLELVITICEEQGLLGAKNLAFSKIRGKRGIAMDTSGTDLVINRAPAANRFKIDIFGHEAHAGICPEQGISAIQIAARAVAKMPLGRIDQETTANIGLFNGGQAINIIPKTVNLLGEVRSHNPEKLRELTEQIIRIVEEEVLQASSQMEAADIQASMAMELHEDYPSMSVAEDAGIIKLIKEAGASLGRPQAIHSAGGGSDANIFNSHGIEMVIVGCGMNKVHTVNEQVAVDDMVKVSELLVEIIRRA